MTPNKPLLILNASAGSGKTYNLVRHYLVLLLKGANDKADLGQLIAMTFTNKAATEMRMRILRDLNKLAHHLDSRYSTEIATIISISEGELQKNAQLVMKKMLHRFEDFNVLTIDKFNLRLIRSFSRDLDLPEHFEVVMDEGIILQKAVDDLLSTIDVEAQSELYNSTLQFAKDNLEEETKWNVRNALIEIGQVLRVEKSFAVIEALSEHEFSETDRENWKIRTKAIELEVESWQRKIVLSVESSDCENKDFSNGSTTFGTLKKIYESTASIQKHLKELTFTDSFIKHLQKTISEKNNPEPSTTVLQFINFWTSTKPEYFKLVQHIKQFNLLSILKELTKSMEKIRQNDGVIRISEFNKLISELVKDEEAPFIYERLGNRFKHFFLDEFQDTSRLQWTNLVPMVHESLSHGKFNLIVGDPKQSIYRFKNGVAEQFVALPKIYNPENEGSISRKSHYFDEAGKRDELKDNWRSCTNIVEFNNTFFKALKPQLPEKGQSFYNQIKQYPKGKKGGYVEFEIADTKERDENDENPRLNRLEKWISDCLSDGYKPNDICILGRKKDELNIYVNHLKSIGYQVVSSDSLLVNSDSNVRLIIDFCNWRNNSSSHQLAMRFAVAYFNFKDAVNGFQRYDTCFDLPDEQLEVQNSKKRFHLSKFYSESGFDKTLLSMPYADIFSLIQQFIRAIGINELNNAYVHQLLDIAVKFDLNHGPDLSAFLEYYQDRGCKENVQMPDSESSIKAMTAHKAKGLEFPIVLIPNLKFDTSPSSKDSQIIALDGHFLETKLTEKEAIIPIIEELRKEEVDAQIMDTANLVYVAFTRPIDRLYVYGEVASTKKNGVNEDVKSFTIKTYKSLKELYPQFIDGNSIRGFVGEKTSAQLEENVQIETAFNPVSLNNFLWFPDISILSPEEDELTDLNQQRQFGRQFHTIMEQSKTIGEALVSLEYGIIKGTINSHFKNDLTQRATELFENEVYQTYLNCGIQLDERTLILDEKIRLRPDKIIVKQNQTIIIDFKTGEEKPDHTNQVRSYCSALESMNYPNCEGVLIYVNSTIRLKKV